MPAPTRGPVCDACWEAIPWHAPVPATTRTLCPHVTDLVAAAPYLDPLPAVIQALKYGRHQTVADGLAVRMAAHPDAHLDRVDVVVPVPLHPFRRLARGFNQAERLARRLGPPVLHALVRPSRRPAQATLPAAARRTNVQDAFALAPRFTAAARAELLRRLCGARVLLVDDVTTTGGTLEACALVLRRAGVADVRALTAAWVP